MRREPYTAIGIKRVSCSRCGSKPSHATWNICADKVNGKTQYRALCVECDIGMNRLAMEYVFGDTRDADVAKYVGSLR